jgi:toxin-antitoxin system PIN domain toxin
MSSFLVDVNVWLALSSDRHTHYTAAHQWFDTVEPGQAAFCRLTQLGYLRLLTNARVMGMDVLSPRQAWEIYDRLRQDVRVSFVPEPPDTEAAFRRLTARTSVAPATWTDAYLAALASAKGLTVASFDRGFRRMPGIDTLILTVPAAT